MMSALSAPDLLPRHPVAPLLAALALPDFIMNHVGWWAFGLIVVIGLVVLGLRDVSRFSLKRSWAISSVCFSESLRRRVLWVTPLAMLGVIIISQLQRPIDEQDAIRQTTKFALFATGLLVVITTIILACTNLPREIENRVIYTVVTKPTTRLEIVLGKVLGFARTSLLILLIMGVFTWGYLAFRAWRMQRYIAQRLQSNEVPEQLQATLAHYRDEGLLTAKTLANPDDIQIYARLPDKQHDRYWLSGSNQQDLLVPFDITPDMLPTADELKQHPDLPAMIAVVLAGYEQYEIPKAAPKPSETPEVDAFGNPVKEPYYGPFIVPPEERGGKKPPERPRLSLSLLDSNYYAIPGITIAGGQPLPLLDPEGKLPIQGLISADSVDQLRATVTKNPRVYLQIDGPTANTDYFFTRTPAELVIPIRNQAIGQATAPGQPEQPAELTFRGRNGSYGQQLAGGHREHAPVAVLSFKNAKIGAVEDGRVPMELRIGIERSGDEVDESEDVATEMEVRVHNRASGEISPVQTIKPETLRPSFFTVPEEAVRGGDFDVYLRILTPGHYAGFQSTSLALVSGRHNFAWNLAKSLLILWLMAILVTTVAIFTSTFLSWPIAVVLTLVILLGHWGVLQLGDATQPGIGNQVATDIFGAGAPSAAKMKAVSASVEALSKLLNAVSSVLPDISRYAALEDIEQGISISPARLGEAAAVTFGFGIPLVVLAYVFLKNKEVAP